MSINYQKSAMVNLINNEINKLKNIANSENNFSINQQVELVKQISNEPNGLFALLELLIERRLDRKISLSCLDGIIFRYLQSSQIKSIQEKIAQHFTKGVVRLESSSQINYTSLYESLISSNLQEANKLTQIHLRELANIKNREWLYFTDVINLPSKDLRTIDALWRIYSEGQFGFSIQRQIWIYSDKNWDKFWHRIGWKINNRAIRYPHEFTWNYTAPQGHLPLFNQLRGVQVLATLFNHPAWDTENENM